MDVLWGPAEADPALREDRGLGDDAAVPAAADGNGRAGEDGGLVVDCDGEVFDFDPGADTWRWPAPAAKKQRVCKGDSEDDAAEAASSCTP